MNDLLTDRLLSLLTELTESLAETPRTDYAECANLERASIACANLLQALDALRWRDR